MALSLKLPGGRCSHPSPDPIPKVLPWQPGSGGVGNIVWALNCVRGAMCGPRPLCDI